jgi:hypothetical protein
LRGPLVFNQRKTDMGDRAVRTKARKSNRKNPRLAQRKNEKKNK